MPAGFPHIADVGSDTPAHVAAGAVLRARLRTVEKLLRRSRDEEPPSSETIHLLRASTRKAGAAFEAFASLIPRRRLAKVRTRLRRIRRAAGSIRDGDVAVEILRDLSTQAPELPGLADTIEAMEARRQSELEALASAISPRMHRKLRKARRRLLTRLEDHDPEDQPATFADVAPAALTAAIERARTAAAADLTSLDSLHCLRIALRKLRFALELFEPCVPSAAAILPPLRDLVSLLGRVNDLARVAALCEELSSGAQHGTGDPTGLSLSARFAMIRDRRHAHAIKALDDLESALLLPLGQCLTQPTASAQPGQSAVVQPIPPASCDAAIA